MRKQPSSQNRFARFTSVLAIAALSLFGITPAASANGGLVLEFPNSSPIDVHVSYPYEIAQFHGGAVGDAVWTISLAGSSEIPPFEMIKEVVTVDDTPTVFGSLGFTDDITAGTYVLDIALSVDGSGRGTLRITVNVFDDVLPTTITQLDGSLGLIPGDRIFASAFERYLSPALLVDPNGDPLNEYVYRITSRPNDSETLVDPQSIVGYDALTGAEQQSWYEGLGFSSPDPYQFSWESYICLGVDGEIALPINMRIEYANFESTLVDGDVDPGLQAAYIAKGEQAFMSGSIVGRGDDSGIKGDWRMSFGDVLYAYSLITGDCLGSKRFASVGLVEYDPYSFNGFSNIASKDFIVPNELVGITNDDGEELVRFSASGATLSVTGDFLSNPEVYAFGSVALFGVTQVLPAEAVVVSAPAAAPYVGPVVASVTVASVTNEAAAGDQVTVTGSSLSSVTSVSIDGISIAVTNATDESFSFVLPEGITPGIKDITIVSGSGSLLSQQLLTVIPQTSVAQTVSAWTKLLPNGSVKVYAKNIVGAGKVQFKVNGEEIAWVRAVDEADPKLRFANDAYYFVRTINLTDGKNAIEVFVDGERQRRVAYTVR